MTCRVLVVAWLPLMLLQGCQLCKGADGHLALLASSSKCLTALLDVSQSKPAPCPSLGGVGCWWGLLPCSFFGDQGAGAMGRTAGL